MLTDAADKSPPQLNEAFISLDTISYGKQYALDIYDPANNDTITYKRATSLSVDKMIKMIMKVPVMVTVKVQEEKLYLYQ